MYEEPVHDEPAHDEPVHNEEDEPMEENEENHDPQANAKGEVLPFPTDITVDVPTLYQTDHWKPTNPELFTQLTYPPAEEIRSDPLWVGLMVNRVGAERSEIIKLHDHVLGVLSEILATTEVAGQELVTHRYLLNALACQIGQISGPDGSRQFWAMVRELKKQKGKKMNGDGNVVRGREWDGTYRKRKYEVEPPTPQPRNPEPVTPSQQSSSPPSSGPDGGAGGVRMNKRARTAPPQPTRPMDERRLTGSPWSTPPSRPLTTASSPAVLQPAPSPSPPAPSPPAPPAPAHAPNGANAPPRVFFPPGPSSQRGDTGTETAPQAAPQTAPQGRPLQRTYRVLFGPNEIPPAPNTNAMTGPSRQAPLDEVNPFLLTPNPAERSTPTRRDGRPIRVVRRVVYGPNEAVSSVTSQVRTDAAEAEAGPSGQASVLPSTPATENSTATSVRRTIPRVHRVVYGPAPEVPQPPTPQIPADTTGAGPSSHRRPFHSTPRSDVARATPTPAAQWLFDTIQQNSVSLRADAVEVVEEESNLKAEQGVDEAAASNTSAENIQAENENVPAHAEDAPVPAAPPAPLEPAHPFDFRHMYPRTADVPQYDESSQSSYRRDLESIARHLDEGRWVEEDQPDPSLRNIPAFPWRGDN